jgi:very-short-patch-repair endonuclease
MDVAVARLAARQEAMVSTAQMRELGITDRAVEVRARRGGLHRVHRGVYIVGVRRMTPLGRLWAAVLACGGPDAAVISHDTAAVVYSMRERWPLRVDLTTLRRSGSTPAIRMHTSLTLDADRDVIRRNGLPVTTPSRVLVDQAPYLTDHALERPCHEATFREILDASEIDRLLEGSPHGSRALRRAVAAVTADGPQITKSELENMFLALIADHRLPSPLVNAPLHGYTVDFLWPDRNLVVETDGRNHLRPAVFESDRERDALLQLHGYRVIRVTWRQLTKRPAAVARTVQQLLS